MIVDRPAPCVCGGKRNIYNIYVYVRILYAYHKNINKNFYKKEEEGTNTRIRI